MTVSSKEDVQEELRNRFDHYTAYERFDIIDTGHSIAVEDAEEETDEELTYDPDNKEPVWEEVYNLIVDME